MKYDNLVTTISQGHENLNIVRKSKKKKVELMDIFIIQAALCVVVSIGLMISKLF